MEIDGRISYVSPAVERVRGFTADEARRQTLEEVHPPESVARVPDYYTRLFTAIESGTEPPTFRGVQEYYRKDGSIMVGDLSVVPQVGRDGEVIRILGVTRDISEQREYEERLHYLAVTDPLTTAWNRRHGNKLLAAALDESGRYGTAMSILMLDIDHFKSVNDMHGHQTGDRVLVEVSQRIAEHIRPSDDLIRWGGEEFIILARHAGLDEAMVLATKVLDLIAEEPFSEACIITVSIGVAQVQADDAPDLWIQRADLALYDAKSGGRNQARPRS